MLQHTPLQTASTPQTAPDVPARLDPPQIARGGRLGAQRGCAGRHRASATGLAPKFRVGKASNLLALAYVPAHPRRISLDMLRHFHIRAFLLLSCQRHCVVGKGGRCQER